MSYDLSIWAEIMVSTCAVFGGVIAALSLLFALGIIPVAQVMCGAVS